MARKKPVDAEEAADPPEDTTPPEPTASERMRAEVADSLDSDEIRGLYEALQKTKQAQGYARVYRRGEHELEFVYLTNVPVDSLVPDPEAVVARQFGGGEYKLQFCQSDGTYIRQLSWKVHPSVPPGEFFQRKAEAAAANPTTALVPAPGNNMEFLIAMLKMQSDQATANLNMMAQQQAAMMTAMTSMVAALKGGGGGGQAGPDTFLNALAVYDKLKGRSADMMDPMLKALDFMRKMIEDKAKESDDSPPWVDFASSILEGFMRRMQGQQAQQGGGAPPPYQGQGLPPAPAGGGAAPPYQGEPKSGETPDLRGQPATANPQPTTTIEVNEQQPMKISILARMLLPNLIERIAAGATPDDGLDMLNNPMMVTDDQYDELVVALKPDTWAKDLFGSEALLEPHRAWFDKLRELILAQAKEEEESDKAT